MPFPTPEDLPDLPEPTPVLLLHWHTDSLLSEPPGKWGYLSSALIRCLSTPPPTPPQCEMRPKFPAVTREQSRTPPCNMKGLLTSVRQQERFPEIPVATREEHQVSRHNLRKTTRFPYSTRDEALFPCITSKATPSSLLKLERGLDSLYTTQEVSDSLYATQEVF